MRTVPEGGMVLTVSGCVVPTVSGMPPETLHINLHMQLHVQLQFMHLRSIKSCNLCCNCNF